MKHLLHYILFASISLPLSAKEHKLPQRETELPMQCTMPEDHDLSISLYWFVYCTLSNKPEYDCLLEETAETLNSLPDTLIYVYGHVDRRGNDNYNQKLSEKRAIYWAEKFKLMMNNQKKFQAIGASHNYPLIPDAKDESDYEWNRRAEIRLKKLE